MSGRAARASRKRRTDSMLAVIRHWRYLDCYADIRALLREHAPALRWLASR